MKYSEIGFRNIYHNFWVIPLKENLKIAVKDFPDIDKADCLLVYGYIDKEAGLTVEVLAAGKQTGNSFFFYDACETMRAMLRIGSIEEDDFYYYMDDSGELWEKHREKIEMLSHYEASEEVEESRKFSFLDASRHPHYPDDVQVYLLNDTLRPEVCWARITGLGESRITATLLNEPNQNYACHEGDTIGIFIHETEEGGVICCSEVDSEVEKKEDTLVQEPEASVNKAVRRFIDDRNEENFIAVLKALVDNDIWIPCNAVLSEADQDRIRTLVETGCEEELIGKTFSNEDQIRMVPDILQSGDQFFFPVFSSAEEMGEYGEHFSKIEKSITEAIVLARNNEKQVAGIVLNAFTEPFVIDKELFELVERIKG